MHLSQNAASLDAERNRAKQILDYNKAVDKIRLAKLTDATGHVMCQILWSNICSQVMSS